MAHFRRQSWRATQGPAAVAAGPVFLSLLLILSLLPISSSLTAAESPVSPAAASSPSSESSQGPSDGASGSAAGNKAGANAPISAKIRRYARRLVQKYDADENGRLDASEWRQMKGNPLLADAGEQPQGHVGEHAQPPVRQPDLQARQHG